MYLDKNLVPKDVVHRKVDEKLVPTIKLTCFVGDDDKCLVTEEEIIGYQIILHRHVCVEVVGNFSLHANTIGTLIVT